MGDSRKIDLAKAENEKLNIVKEMNKVTQAMQSSFGKYPLIVHLRDIIIENNKSGGKTYKITLNVDRDFYLYFDNYKPFVKKVKLEWDEN